MHAQPAPLIGKRKRPVEPSDASHTSVQIIAGSYERALQGLVADIPAECLEAEGNDKDSTFSSNFLFNAHASSIRCLAVSQPSEPTPQQPARRILATGGADEKINLYQIAASAPDQKASYLRTQANRELGSLLHHSATVSTLSFPSKGKLVSGSLDNTISISRVRDWTLLSSIHVPIPKTQGRPTGDTATPGEVPAGVNDVAVHPSAKLALSVGQGERCMRLWNLITGKRGGVLTFDKDMLTALGEGRWRRGEARGVTWSPDGEQFAVSFERGAILYGLDCKIRGTIKVEHSKICRSRYMYGLEVDATTSKPSYVLALSTEDGRVLFYNTARDLKGDSTGTKVSAAESNSSYPLLAQVVNANSGTRIKDFSILSTGETAKALLITGSSDGGIDIWCFDHEELLPKGSTSSSKKSGKDGKDKNGEPAAAKAAVTRSIGRHLGRHETHKRITCLEAFIMTATTSNIEAARGNEPNGAQGHLDAPEDDFEGFDEEG